jgi:ribonuclease HI
VTTSDESLPLPRVTVYTDGGCRPNPGPGGWGVVVLLPGKRPQELNGGEPDTTNNRMELTAAIEALRAIPTPHQVELVTDSQYVRRGVTEWLGRWQGNGWQTADRKEVQNRDLWEALAAELERHRVVWRWTRGHTGDRYNERADRLASAAIPGDALPLDDPDAVHLFAAVAYSGKSGAGGWAVVLRYRARERTLAAGVQGTSPNRLHLEGAVAGLEALKRPTRVHLYTASDYLKDGATSWLGAWKGRGFRTQEGKPVSHRDLWQRLDRLLARHRVTWHVVRSEAPPEPLAAAKTLAREAVARLA